MCKIGKISHYWLKIIWNRIHKPEALIIVMSFSKGITNAITWCWLVLHEYHSTRIYTGNTKIGSQNLLRHNIVIHPYVWMFLTPGTKFVLPPPRLWNSLECRLVNNKKRASMVGITITFIETHSSGSNQPPLQGSSLQITFCKPEGQWSTMPFIYTTLDPLNSILALFGLLKVPSLITWFSGC